MNNGFFRVACCSPEIKIADCDYNADKIIECTKNLAKEGASCIVFPELCVTGATCGDLFLQESLLTSAFEAVQKIADETSASPVLIFVGLPFAFENKIYSVAAAIQYGKVLAFIPKTNVSSLNENGDSRWFSSYMETGTKELMLSGMQEAVVFGTDVLFCDAADKNVKIAVELEEDLFVPVSPSVRHSLAGATVIVNLSSKCELVGRAVSRRLNVSSASLRLNCVYVYSESGTGESSTDFVFSGHSIICENGIILEETKPFSGGYALCDVDVDRVVHERRSKGNLSAAFSGIKQTEYRNIDLMFSRRSAKLIRKISQNPFVPEDETQRNVRAGQILSMQVQGLLKRMKHIGCKTVVLGLSGGLDSTLALIVCVEAFKKNQLPLENIRVFTLPCFGTSERTHNNAFTLAKELGVNIQEIRIEKAVLQHFEDIGHDKEIHDTAFENAQARERTQILMDYANMCSGMVIGTGDLSELALGWATFNGDHMANYGVNADIPKTLIRFIVKWYADKNEKSKLAQVLYDILATPVSPELLPPQKGEISQKTEDLVGPYELHDFFLYYMIRWGFSPKKIRYLAEKAFEGIYDRESITKFLKIFIKRFFNNQFKRSCLPDGVAVGSVGLSPRASWKMPSDACYTQWLKELE